MVSLNSLLIQPNNITNPPPPPKRFPSWFRAKVQAALTETWTMALPPLQPISPAHHVARILEAELGGGGGGNDDSSSSSSPPLSQYVFVDFCAGGGGPTPTIERYLNEGVIEDGSWGGGGAGGSGSGRQRRLSSSGGRRDEHKNPPARQRRSFVSEQQQPKKAPVHFVLTDLHPHIPNYARAASLSPNMHYAPRPVDAADAPADLLATVEPPLPPPPPPPRPSSSSSSASHNPFSSLALPKTFRTFCLAFHHFPDALASRILHNTITTSSGFAIIELQDRSLGSFISVCLLGVAVMVFSPLFAWRWRSPGTWFWCWVIPVLPFVLVWDGWMSSVRTRTVDEVQDLMRTCGVDSEEVAKWRVRSGRVTHLPPWADVNWIIATKDED